MKAEKQLALLPIFLEKGIYLKINDDGVFSVEKGIENLWVELPTVKAAIDADIDYHLTISAIDHDLLIAEELLLPVAKANLAVEVETWGMAEVWPFDEEFDPERVYSYLPESQLRKLEDVKISNTETDCGNEVNIYFDEKTKIVVIAIEYRDRNFYYNL